MRDVFEGMLADEPPMELTVDDIVAAGDRELAGRRRRVGLSLAAAAVLVVGLVAVALRVAPGDDDGGVAVTAPPPSPITTEPPTTTTMSTTTTTAAPPTTPEEQLPDPGFEADPPGWAAFGPATELTPTPDARTGDQALLVATTAGEKVVAGATNRPVQVSTVAGRSYRATCRVRADRPVDARIQLQEYTTTWARAGDPAPSPEVTLADPSRWYELTVTYTAARSGNQLPLTVLSADLAPDGLTFVVDDCSLVTLQP